MKNDNIESQSNHQIILGGMISYAIIGLNVLLGLIYTPWILRSVGSSQYGLYTLASSLITLFLMDFGMSAAVTRYIAVYRAKGTKTEIDQVFTIVVKLYFGIMVVVAVIFAFVYQNLTTIYSNLLPAELEVFKGIFAITAFCVIVCFPVNICNGVLNAYEEFIAIKLCDIINRVGTVIVTIILLSNDGGIYSLVIVSGVFNIITFVVKLLVMKLKTGVCFVPRFFDVKRLKEIASFSVWSTISSVAQQLVFNIIPSIIAMTLNTAAITMFGFSNVIEGYFSTITGAINGMFLPKVSRVINNKEDASSILPLMVRVGRVNQSIVSILLIGLLIIGKKFISLWLGNEYLDVYYCIVILVLPYCLSSSLEIASTSLIATNQIRYTAIINIISGILNLVVAYLVAPHYGVIGVCTCICLTYLLRILANLSVYSRVLHIELGKFFASCHVKMLPSFGLSTGISYIVVKFGLSKITTNIGWIGLLLEACCVAVIFFITMWLFGWNESEKAMILTIIQNKK